MSLTTTDPLFTSAEAYARGRNYSNLVQINPLMFASAYIEHMKSEPPDNWQGIKEYFHFFVLSSFAVESED